MIITIFSRWSPQSPTLDAPIVIIRAREYEVIGTALHSETGEKLVVYKALYNDGGLWVRPYDMFKEIIEKDGKKIQRFTPID